LASWRRRIGRVNSNTKRGARVDICISRAKEAQRGEACFAHNKINVECSPPSSIIGEDDQAPSKQQSISITNLARETHFI
jgi:hypothetical protein